MPSRVAPPVLRVEIEGPVAKVRGFLAAHPTEIDSVVFDHDFVRCRAFLDENLVALIAREGLDHRILFDATAQSRAHRAGMGTGNRFDHGRIPEGLGVKTP